jgi:hypothetical protein
MPASPPELLPEDRELLERLARRIVELRLETPALLTLETGRPLSLLAGQAMIFFEPFVQALFRLPDYQRVAALVERRDALESLAQMIERGADERMRKGRPPQGAAPSEARPSEREPRERLPQEPRDT